MSEEKQDVFSSDKTAQTPLENDHKNTLAWGSEILPLHGKARCVFGCQNRVFWTPLILATRRGLSDIE